MKNYYEVLEVNENASKEIIEKAYKVLAKKYHPDLQEDKNKKAAEEKIKVLNEAYEVLSDPGKKQSYDTKLQRAREDEERKKEMQHTAYVNNVQSFYKNQYGAAVNNTTTQKEQKKINKKFQKEYKKELLRLKVIGFLRKVGAICLVLGIVFLIGFLIYKIPATNKWIQNIINNNSILKLLIDSIS